MRTPLFFSTFNPVSLYPFDPLTLLMIHALRIKCLCNL